MKSQFNSLIQVLDFFKDEERCKQYLAQQRWGDTPACPHCGCVKAYVTNRGYKCSEKLCHKKFTVTTGTIFENTKIKLRTWFAAMYLVTAHKKCISSLQLSRDLNITQKSAWFVLHRIREMLKEKAPQMLEGTVEADETYVGGKAANKHKKVRKELREKGTGYVHKTPVSGLLQRNGKVHTFIVAKADGSTLKPILREKVSSDAMLVTDGFGGYKDLYKELKAHKVINHAQDEYVRGEFHTTA
ncbi:IS1595 family transposase [Rufibacter immobilis]|uniref:IS1595 family transposase n=1 Tax=Rufibacter immobilis TaxID=1348778 RepID=A0A3M9MS04_9BACT|nr:IS1595 family transposase [Rufibacter immobilis]RNI28296.1 IS1595 family transposase [Rufibacter immobilis]